MENSMNESRENPGLEKCAQIPEVNGNAAPQEAAAVRSGEETAGNTPVPAGQPEVRRPPVGDASRFAQYGIYSLFYAALFALGVYRNPGGIAITVPVAAFFLMFGEMRKRAGGKVFAAASGAGTAMQRFLAVSAVLLSVNVWTSASTSLQTLDKLGIILLTAVFLLRCRADERDWDPGRYLEGIAAVIFRPLVKLPRPFQDFGAFLKKKKKDGEAGHAASAVAKGLVIAVPLLIVAVGLLAGADSVFENMLDGLFENLEIPELAADVAEILFLAAAGLAAFYTFASEYSGTGRADEERNSGKKQGDPVTAITFTLPLTAVYMVFCGIQAVYLTGGRSLPEGISYWEYAHAGFYQLAAVCALNFVLVVFCEVRYRRHRILTALLVAVTLCTYIMIASSAARMIMYVRAYDLTFLRLFVLWFLVVLSVWLGAVLAGILRGGMPVFRFCLAAGTVLYLLFAFAHPDYWIAKYNIAAAEQRTGGNTGISADAGPEYGAVSAEEIAANLDWNYLCGTLSDDAVPALKGNRALLERREEYHKEERRPGEEKSFAEYARTWNLSEFLAERSLAD